MQNDVYLRAMCIISPSIYGISVNGNGTSGRIKLQVPAGAISVPILSRYGSSLQVRLQRFIVGTERRYLLNDRVVAQTQVVQVLPSSETHGLRQRRTARAAYQIRFSLEVGVLSVTLRPLLTVLPHLWRVDAPRSSRHVQPVVSTQLWSRLMIENRCQVMFRPFRILLAAALLLTIVEGPRAEAQPYQPVKLFYCAYGSIAFQPHPLPPGFENQFAVAVIEVNSQDAEPMPPASITLIDRAGRHINTKRLISVEVFDEPYIAGEGNGAYYLNHDPRGNSHPLSGSIHGMTHLRLRVALDTQTESDALSGRCRVTFGRYMIEGPVDGIWPT